MCFYHQNAKLMVEAIETGCPAGLEKLENKVFSGKKAKNTGKVYGF